MSVYRRASPPGTRRCPTGDSRSGRRPRRGSRVRHRGLRRPARRNPKSPRSAPASRPLPAIQGLPAPIASSSRTKASAVMSAPLAKASARATSRWGGLQKAPATAPITKAMDAARPSRRTVSTVSAFAHREGVDRTRGHSFVRTQRLCPSPIQGKNRERETPEPRRSQALHLGQVGDERDRGGSSGNVRGRMR